VPVLQQAGMPAGVGGGVGMKHCALLHDELLKAELHPHVDGM
jgi:hypothetical protein